LSQEIKVKKYSKKGSDNSEPFFKIFLKCSFYYSAHIKKPQAVSNIDNPMF
jgi:hypothetical protein